MSAGHQNLARAISRHGGARLWAERLGLTLRPQVRGYPADAALADARAVIADHGHLPGSTKLRQLNYSGLAEHVVRAGGAAAFCAAHGLPLPPPTLRGQRRPA